MIGFIFFLMFIYGVVGFLTYIFGSPVTLGASHDEAISRGMFWFFYLVRGIYRTVVRSLVILFHS